MLLRDINSLEVSNLNKEYVKSRLVDSTYISFKQFSKISEKNPSKKEVKAFNNLVKNKDIVIQKTDKGNNVVNLKFVTSVYRKPTFSGVFTNLESFIPDKYKHGFIETLLHGSFRLCSNYENFHREFET